MVLARFQCLFPWGFQGSCYELGSLWSYSSSEPFQPWTPSGLVGQRGSWILNRSDDLSCACPPPLLLQPHFPLSPLLKSARFFWAILFFFLFNSAIVSYPVNKYNLDLHYLNLFERKEASGLGAKQRSFFLESGFFFLSNVPVPNMFIASLDWRFWPWLQKLDKKRHKERSLHRVASMPLNPPVCWEVRRHDRSKKKIGRVRTQSFSKVEEHANVFIFFFFFLHTRAHETTDFGIFNEELRYLFIHPRHHP